LESLNNALAAVQKNENTDKPAAVTDTSKASEGGRLAALGAQADSTKRDSAAAGQSELARQNPSFAVLRPSIFMGQQGQQQLATGPIIGTALLRDTAKVNAFLHSEVAKQIIPANLRLLWSVKPDSRRPDELELYAIKPTGLDHKPVLGGNVITDARAD